MEHDFENIPEVLRNPDYNPLLAIDTTLPVIDAMKRMLDVISDLSSCMATMVVDERTDSRVRLYLLSGLGEATRIMRGMPSRTAEEMLSDVAIQIEKSLPAGTQHEVVLKGIEGGMSSVIGVVKVLRDHLQIGLNEARDMTRNMPVSVGIFPSLNRAMTLVSALVDAGAVVEHYRKEPVPQE